MEFEWSPDKAESNYRKHGVSFEEAATVFNDSLSVTFPDPGHSIGESRYVIIGISRFGQLLIIAHTDQGETIRIISARKATGSERRFYEQES
ncbi:MAG: BrnT family toxin [Cyanomargarita calcarea GSE-NOS-MK-12-04C]|jgi:hypothetical protein|uniref:BrnT family toxin n=1 Tax=Cyanomargarita calcarea GSE-NOS-MK-12-04C TaxID=2839659 RepID=A0A951QL58_9CYAN|nr:BrnT family toxin [Cyanomargarita calcarea GSE-NOS-MK-12-04C]